MRINAIYLCVHATYVDNRNCKTGFDMTVNHTNITQTTNDDTHICIYDVMTNILLHSIELSTISYKYVDVYMCIQCINTYIYIYIY